MSPVNPHIQTNEKMWYQEFYLWLVLAPLIAVVCASMVMMTIAFSMSDDLVVDNYYREGKMLAQDFAADEYAKSIGLSGQFRLLSKRVEIDLNQAPADKRLLLLVSHPANAAQDQTLRLTPYQTTKNPDNTSSTTYIAQLESELSGRWYLRLSAYAYQQSSENELWRLHGEVDLSRSSSTDLR